MFAPLVASSPDVARAHTKRATGIRQRLLGGTGACQVHPPEPFDSADWLLEPRMDGGRALAHVNGHPCSPHLQERPRLGTAPSADELALELDDFVGMLPAAVRDGTLSEEQATGIRKVSELTASFSGSENAALWHVDQLDARQWSEVRRSACAALQLLRGDKPER